MGCKRWHFGEFAEKLTCQIQEAFNPSLEVYTRSLDTETPNEHILFS